MSKATFRYALWMAAALGPLRAIEAQLPAGVTWSAATTERYEAAAAFAEKRRELPLAARRAREIRLRTFPVVPLEVAGGTWLLPAALAPAAERGLREAARELALRTARPEASVFQGISGRVVPMAAWADRAAADDEFVMLSDSSLSASGRRAR
jgi:hypothetical protein